MCSGSGPGTMMPKWTMFSPLNMRPDFADSIYPLLKRSTEPSPFRLPSLGGSGLGMAYYDSVTLGDLRDRLCDAPQQLLEAYRQWWWWCCRNCRLVIGFEEHHVKPRRCILRFSLRWWKQHHNHKFELGWPRDRPDNATRQLSEA